MTDTQRNIKELKAALPRMREKVIAVAVLLALSVTMMASVSYAWYTLSLSPEVTSIKTQVSSNGSLEVALAGLYDENGDLIEPLASAIGDSFSAQGKETVDANRTWGNLINLSQNYGIESLVLRPATLAENSQKILSSMYYGADGRLHGTNVDFGLTSWQKTTSGYAFLVPSTPVFGVRAVSSVTYPKGKGPMLEKLDEAEGVLTIAATNYGNVVGSKAYIETIQKLVEVYVDAVLNNQDADCSEYIDDLYKMMHELHYDVICEYGRALAELVNAIQSMTDKNYDPLTLEEFLAAKREDLPLKGRYLNYSYDIFSDIYSETLTDMGTLKKLYDDYEASGRTTTVKWSQIDDIVDNLIAINKVEVNGMTVKEIQKMASENIMGLMGLLSDADAVVYDGTLRDIELLLGAKLNAKISFKVKYGISVPISATVHTDLLGQVYDVYFKRDKALTEAEAASGDLEYTGTLEAGDTYGMVIDLWVRTNAANSQLMLDGLVSLDYYDELLKTVLDGQSESTQVFLYTYTVKATVEGKEVEELRTIKVYNRPEDLDGVNNIATYELQVKLNQVGTEVDKTETVTVSEGYFYDINTHAKVYVMDNGEATETPITYENVTPATKEIEVTTGFSASNRVDDSYDNLASAGNISATQGTGSCYIFYASTPEEYNSTVELLKHMKLAFIDQNCSFLASAFMDVKHIYDDNGRYIVPIVIDKSYAEDANGNKAVTNLVQNEATFISVVVYLEGNGLENDMVIDKGTIQGSLNIQFASSEDLSSMKDTDLSIKEIGVTATISKNDFDSVASASTTLTATITGLEPAKVEASFMRRINATQASKCKPITFTKEGTNWVGAAKFDLPGTYVLNSLLVDGIVYTLPEAITVTVDGFALNNISFAEGNDALAMTADNFTTRDISVKFVKDQNPSKVSVRIRKMLTEEEEELGAVAQYVTADLIYDEVSDTWNGTARFTASGNYVLEFLVLDDGYFDVLSENKTFSAYLGLQTNVFLSRLDENGNSLGLNFKYEGKPQQIKILAQILTEDDKELSNLNEIIELVYGRRGSTSYVLKSPLTWNGTYYEGAFTVSGSGVYNFSYMSVGSNTLSAANNAPTITAYSPDPPQLNNQQVYLGSNSVNNNFIMMTGSAETFEFMATMSNVSGASSISAVFRNESGQKTEVFASKMVENTDGTTRVYFTIPTGDAYRNTTITVTEIHVAGVFDSANNWYGEPAEGLNTVAPYYTTTVDNAQVTVMHDVDVDLIADPSTGKMGITLGTSTSNAHVFMTTQSMTTNNGHLKGSIAYRVAPGIALPDSLAITKVQLVLTHQDNSVVYGGYSYTRPTTLREGFEVLTYDLVYDSASGTWCLPSNAAATLAGTYTDNLIITIDDNPSTGLDNIDAVEISSGGYDKAAMTVYSIAPRFSIDSITPLGPHTCASENGTKNVTSKIEGNTITIYAYSEVTGSGCDKKGVLHQEPIVRLKFTGLGMASRATLTFRESNDGEVRMYYGTSSKEGTQTPAYLWDASTGEVVSRFIGYNDAGSCNDSKPAGTLISESAVVLEYTMSDGTVEKFTVAISAITINNPAL